KTPAGTRTVVKTAKTKVTSHSVIGAIHSSVVHHVSLKKPSPKPETNNIAKKKRKGDDTSAVDVKLVPKGTTTVHSTKFVNEFFDIMNEDEYLKDSYLVMDNASIHKSKPIIRKIKVKGYRIMYLSPLLA
ncbi:hypothetical protein BCV72DRAFT_324490, partial [Rhizopus microsporus var. microsporus]